MQTITLRNGVQIPHLGFGTWPLKGLELQEVLKQAYSVGYRLFDSAHMYDNEDDIGLFMQNAGVKRDEIILSSKLQGIQYIGRRRYLYLDKRTVNKAYMDSCKKFGTDYLDLYLLHSPFHGFEDAYKELMSLFDKGKVRARGVSNFDIDELVRLHNECGVYPMLNQIELHPYNTTKDIVAFCIDHQIQVVAYSPFGRGNLMKDIMNDELLTVYAEKYGKTVGQIVLRWIVQQGVIPIPRSTNLGRMKDNMDIFDFCLSESEMKYIDSMNRDCGYGKHFQ